MEGDKLYSIKWYRNGHEFYRYIPSDNPSTTIFNGNGINVDKSQSSEEEILLRSVDLDTTGLWKKNRQNLFTLSYLSFWRDFILLKLKIRIMISKIKSLKNSWTFVNSQATHFSFCEKIKTIRIIISNDKITKKSDKYFFNENFKILIGHFTDLIFPYRVVSLWNLRRSSAISNGLSRGRSRSCR